MELNLEKLEQLAKAATSRPWEATHDINGDIAPFIVGKTGWVLGEGFDPEHGGDCWVRPSFDDLEYIVAACNAVPELVARVRELEAQRDWLASKLGDMCSVSSHGSCGVSAPCPYSNGYCRCLDAGQEEWVQVAKETKC